MLATLRTTTARFLIAAPWGHPRSVTNRGTRRWSSPSHGLGLLVALAWCAGDPANGAVVNFTDGNYFSFATGSVGSSPDSSQIRLLYNPATAGSTGVGSTSTHSFSDTNQYYSFITNATGPFQAFTDSQRHIRFLSASFELSDLRLQNQVSGGASMRCWVHRTSLR